MNVLVLTQRSTSYEVASKPTRNGFVHPLRDANVRLKERGKNPYYFGENQWQKSLIVVSSMTLKSTTQWWLKNHKSVTDMI